MILTNSEIMNINQNAEFDSAIAYARAIESALLEKLKAQEPVAFKQFLSNAHTAAGLLRHGKKDQGLADRLSRGVINYLCHPLPPDDVVRDVERYRWLRDNHNHWSWNPSQYNKDIVSGFSCKDIGYAGYCLQDAIDAAMKEMK